VSPRHLSPGVRERRWASGTVTWEASWYDASGRRHTANYDTRTEAETARAERLRERRLGGSADPTGGRVTLAAWHERWSAGRSVRPRTAERDEAIWRCHIAATLGDRPLASLRRSDIAGWVAGLSAAGLAPSTVTRCLAVLRACLSAAVDDGLIAASPAARVPAPRVDRAERRFLSPGELDALEAAMDDYWSLVVPFAAATGLRIGELSALRVQDLDLADGAVHVRHTAIEVSGRRSLTTPKSSAGIRTTPTVYPALVARLAEHVESRGLARDDWLFAGPSGGPMRSANWRQRVWLPALDDAGLVDPQPTPHSLRHTAIAAWLASGVPVVRAAAWAGHSPRVLESTYAHLLNVDHQPVRARLEELFGGR